MVKCHESHSSTSPAFFRTDGEPFTPTVASRRLSFDGYPSRGDDVNRLRLEGFASLPSFISAQTTTEF